MTEKTRPPEPYAGADWAQQVWLWPLEATKLALHSYAQWFADQKPAPSRAPDQEPLAWTTPNAVVLQLPSMRLREFSRGNATQPPVLVCAPYALHGALIADFAPGHSLVEALQKDGVNRIYVPDWRSADAGHALSVDRQLSRRAQCRDRRDRRAGRSCRPVPGRMAVAGLCRPFSRQGAAAGACRRACRCLHAVRTLEDGGRSSAASFRADGAAGRRPRQRRAHAQALEPSVQPA